MGNVCDSPPAPQVIEKPSKADDPFADGLGAIKLHYFPGFQSRGLHLALLLELSKVDYEFVPVDMGAFFGGGKANYIFGYVPEMELSNGTKFAEIAGIGAMLAQYAPKGSSIKVENPGDWGVSMMLALKGLELYAVQGMFYPLPIMGPDDYTADMKAAALKSEEEFAKPLIDTLESICKDDGKFTSTGTSFGEICVFATLHMFVDAKVSGLAPPPPKLQKFIDNICALPEYKKVMDGDTKMGKLAQWCLPLPA